MMSHHMWYDLIVLDPSFLNWYMLQKKCKKCLEAENIPLTDLLFYILEVLDPYRYKSSHLTM